jgi:hypothetical protein
LEKSIGASEVEKIPTLMGLELPNGVTRMEAVIKEIRESWLTYEHNFVSLKNKCNIIKGRSNIVDIDEHRAIVISDLTSVEQTSNEVRSGNVFAIDWKWKLSLINFLLKIVLHLFSLHSGNFKLESPSISKL